VGVISRKGLYSLDSFGDGAGALEWQLEVVPVLEGMTVGVNQALWTVGVKICLIDI
jgi:hypothetical protein